MSSVTLTVPRAYAYVLATSASHLTLTLWHMLFVGHYRKKAKIPYPTPYALDAFVNPNFVKGEAASKQVSAAELATGTARYQFNCAVRAQIQLLEHLPIALLATPIVGLKYPLLATALGAAWTLSRVVYALGYVRADKERGAGRLAGSAGYVASEVVLILLVGRVAWDIGMAPY